MNYKEKVCRRLSTFTGLKNVILFSSCRNALYTLIKSLEFKFDDEVIIQSFICDSLPQAIRKAGAKVISAEVDENTLNLSSKELIKKITQNTKAVVFVHTYGNPSGIKEIAELCKKHNIILIEDIAHALGAKYDGRLAGTFGDYAIYSFTKQMVNFGGGAILTDHNVDKISVLCEKLTEKSRNNGQFLGYIKRLFASLYETRAFFVSMILIDIARRKSNFRQTNDLDRHFQCSNLEAAMAYWQFHSLPNQIKKRQRNYKLLQKYIPTQKIDELAESSCNYLMFRFENSMQRNKAVKDHSFFRLPWPGSSAYKDIAFIPNNPNFSKRKIKNMVAAFDNIYKQSL